MSIRETEHHVSLQHTYHSLRWQAALRELGVLQTAGEGIAKGQGLQAVGQVTWSHPHVAASPPTTVELLCVRELEVGGLEGRGEQLNHLHFAMIQGKVYVRWSNSLLDFQSLPAYITAVKGQGLANMKT